MTRTGLAQDDRFLLHETGPGHPERPARLSAIASALMAAGISQRCIPIPVTPVDLALVAAVHSDDYIRRCAAACSRGAPFIDVPDSVICRESFNVARLAAGAVVSAIDRVMSCDLDNAFCAIRPPGHHAERDSSLGFCLLANVAIAARRLLDHFGLSRVLVLDWDVHHGNGTQHLFEDDPRVLFISIHGHPGVVYPGTGFAHERGVGAGVGFTINCPVVPPSGDDDCRRIFREIVIPAIDGFRPQFILISAGFDAHAQDPLGPLEWSTAIFGWMTDVVLDCAARHCEGRLVSVLEGGYDLAALGESVSLHVQRLLAAPSQR